ncbi:MAG: energy-coupling factor ABC transporter permease [Deltaproteobacteria bacterium]|nr:energy-coupling factor ABC transporter permease [Deltaproteobacteria bacterium]
MITFIRIGIVLFVFVILGSAPERVYAMHISEGILPAQWAGFWFLMSVPFIFFGLRSLRIRSEKEPYFKALVGLVGAGVFVISCMPIPVPTAGTCSHPCGTGIAAILIGPALSVVVASVALTLQALFLAHGGLTTLGANIFSMGVAGSFAGYGIFILSRKIGASWFVAAFLAGLFSDWATYGMTAFILTGALHTDASFWKLFLTILLAFVPTQVPLGILEGFVSAGTYSFIHARRPEFLAMFARGGTA